jgi:hypothetical protein
MKKYLWILLAVMTYGFTHQFHFSETLLEWQPKSSRIACTIRVFTDDLEKEVELKYNIKNTEPKQFEKAAFTCVQEVFQITDLLLVKRDYSIISFSGRLSRGNAAGNPAVRC